MPSECSVPGSGKQTMTGLEAQEQERLKRASNRAALISGLGALLVFAALAFASVQLLGVRREVRELETRRDDLRTEADRFKAEAETLREETQQLEQKRAEMREEIESLGRQWKVASRQIAEQGSFTRALSAAELRKAPLSLAVEPRASTTPIEDELFLFRAWLDVPEARRPEIEKVSYYFNHPTFPQKLLESRDLGSGFAVAYRGWGALDRVIITIELANGSTQEIAFDMLAALGGASDSVDGGATQKGAAKKGPTKSPPGAELP